MSWRSLILPVLVCALGLAAYPLCANSPRAGVTTLMWLALWAAPAGTLTGARTGLASWLVPLAWLAALSPAIFGWPPALDGPRFQWLFGWLVLSGLFGLGVGVGLARPTRSEGDAGMLLLLGAGLAALPSLAGLTGSPPWSPSVTATLLNISPVSLVVESAGIDWMRHPAVYGPAGADALDPLLRLQWEGSVAGPVAILVGCLATWAGFRWTTRTGSAPAPNPHGRDTTSADHDLTP